MSSTECSTATQRNRSALAPILPRRLLRILVRPVVFWFLTRDGRPHLNTVEVDPDERISRDDRTADSINIISARPTNLVSRQLLSWLQHNQRRGESCTLEECTAIDTRRVWRRHLSAGRFVLLHCSCDEQRKVQRLIQSFITGRDKEGCSVPHPSEGQALRTLLI